MEQLQPNVDDASTYKIWMILQSPTAADALRPTELTAQSQTGMT